MKRLLADADVVVAAAVVEAAADGGAAVWAQRSPKLFKATL